MSNGDDDHAQEFYAQFLEDYFAECDEHLTAIKRRLLALEDSGGGQAPTEPTALDELFRSFHTLKGISGMVGLREAEQLAHEMENCLRVLRQGRAELTTEGLDALIAGTALLEQVVAARRTQSTAPDIAPALTRLSSLCEAESNSAPALTEPTKGTETPPTTEGKRRWRFEFTPTAELAERGVNVNAIRERLQRAGEIVRATPQVKAGGGVAFEFIVESADAFAFPDWGEEGVTCAPLDEAAPQAFERRTETSAAGVSVEREPGGDGAGENGVARRDAGPAFIAPAHVVRVGLERLDELMLMIGELVVTRARLESSLRQMRVSVPPAEWRAAQETNAALGRQLRELREGVMRARMAPIGEAFERMRFVVRDLARENGKKVALDLSGQETEIDKFLVERMMDPLLHLVRNAVSHGLEASDERVAAGKPPTGRLALRARTAGEFVLIEVEDDGQGVDLERVTARARERGLIGERARVDAAGALAIISALGFSTRAAADRESGRGVGMDVARNAVLELGGVMTMETERGRGTRFVIELPLTLAVADALIATVGGQTFAVPQASVMEVIEVETASVSAFENNEMIYYRGGALPLVRLARLFNLSARADGAFHAFVVGSGASAVGIAVDRIVGQREIVVRSINDPLVQTPGIAGAAEVGDGRLALILDVPKLLAADGRALNANGAGAR